MGENMRNQNCRFSHSFQASDCSQRVMDPGQFTSSWSRKKEGGRALSTGREKLAKVTPLIHSKERNLEEKEAQWKRRASLCAGNQQCPRSARTAARSLKGGVRWGCRSCMCHPLGVKATAQGAWQIIAAFVDFSFTNEA